MKLKISISVRIVLFTVIVLGVLFAMTGFYYLVKTTRSLDDTLINKGKLMAKLYKPIMMRDVIEANDIALLSQVERMEAVDDVKYAVLVDSNSKVLGHSDVYELGNIYDDTSTRWVVSVKDFSYKKIDEDGESVFLCAIPFNDPQRGIVGFLKLGLSRKSIENTLVKLRKEFYIFVTVFGGIFLILLLLYFYEEIAHPLKLIRDGLFHMRTNLSEFKFKIKAQNEIGDIYRNMNTLVTYLGGEIKGVVDHETKAICAEEGRLEHILSVLYKGAFFVIADENNSIVFSTIPDYIAENVEIGKHIVDVFKDENIIGIITEAYSTKETLVVGRLKCGEEIFNVRAFVLQGQNSFKDRTIIIFQK